MLDKTGKGKFTVPFPLLQLRELSQEMMCGQTFARASRPTRIPRCCRHTPASPGYSMMRAFFPGIASVKGLSEAKGATSSAMLTIARVGTDRLDGPTSVSPISGSATKAVFAIEPFDDLVHQLAREGNLIECPALDYA